MQLLYSLLIIPLMQHYTNDGLHWAVFLKNVFTLNHSLLPITMGHKYICQLMIWSLIVYSLLCSNDTQIPPVSHSLYCLSSILFSNMFHMFKIKGYTLLSLCYPFLLKPCFRDAFIASLWLRFRLCLELGLMKALYIHSVISSITEQSWHWKFSWKYRYVEF